MTRGFQGRTIIFQQGAGASPRDTTAISRDSFVRALEAIARIANEAESVAAGLAQVLDTLCAELGWPIGHVYQLSADDQQVLTSAAIWHLERPEQFAPFLEATRRATFRSGRGLIGQVASRRRPGLSPDVTRDRRFVRRHAAEAAGVRAWLAFPIVADGRVVAVCECFSTERVVLDPSLAGLLSCAGLALGRLYERERWHEERERLLEQLAAAASPPPQPAALSALAGAVAHEINSPLFAARTCLALLAAEQPNEPLIAAAQVDLGRIAATLETLHTLAEAAPLGQRLAQFVKPPTV